MKNVLLIGPHSIVEPLGLMAISRVARQEDWNPSIELVRDLDFSYLERIIAHTTPEVVGASVYTGNHVQTFNWLDEIRRQHPEIQTIVGGPHPTLNPQESSKHADYVVVSEGIDPFRRILQGTAKKGILIPKKVQGIPLADRTQFYSVNPDHKKSPIKSIVTETGCPFECGHCYNSIRASHLESDLEKQDFEDLSQVLGGQKARLFPKSGRSVRDIIQEVDELLEISPETKLIFDQSDVHGVNLDWLKEFAKEFPKLGIPYHSLMRLEYIDPSKDHGKQRLDLMKQAGCTGLTIAIESGVPEIRKEVLNRAMKEDLMFRTFKALTDYELTLRTQQMLGLPYGATKQETPINLDADLETLKLNVRLRQETGLPTMAWAAVYTPYLGTATGDYCKQHGFYSGNNDDLSPDFFTRSVLRFPNKWVGPDLRIDTPNAWLSEEAQEEYRDNLRMLRDLFTIHARIKNGDRLARNLLEKDQGSDPGKYSELSTESRRHIYDHELFKVA